jgi:hypothetical protein
MQRNSRLENIILEILNRMFDFVSRQRDNDNDNDKGD